MMHETDGKAEVELPESLTKQLGVFEKRLCVAESIVALSGAALGMLLTYGLLFASDRFWDTPGWLRLPLTALGGLLLGWFAVSWMRHWWWRRRDSRKLARLVQTEYGRMGDRLLGAVELANGDSTLENVSPALCRAAVNQVASEAADYDFQKAVRMRRPRILSVAFVLVFALILGLFKMWPDAGWNALSRWARPLSAVQRYTFVSVDSIPDSLVVPHGEKFEVSCKLRRDSLWHPPSASCRLEDQPKIETEISGGVALFRVPGQTQEGLLHIRIGDMTKDVMILPKYRPELVSLTAGVSLPDYLKRPDASISIERGKAEFLSGSVVQFHGSATRGLRSARMHSRLGDGASEPELGDSWQKDLKVAGREFHTPKLEVGALRLCEFSWTDELRLSEAQPYLLRAVAVADEPPVVECSGIQRTIAILEDEIVELEVSTEDDYGLKEAWVNWTCVGSEERGVPSSRGTTTMGKGGPEIMSLAGTFSFSPIALGIKEETMTVLRAYASDYLPGRKPAMSVEYRVYVLSRAQHAKFIQQAVEELQARIEELAREQANVVQDAENVSQMDAEKRDSEKATAAMRDQEYTERQNSQQLENLAKDVEKLLKEALRNSDIDEQSLREWAELSESMRELAGGEMSKAAQSLQQAQAGQGEAREQDLKDAIEHARKALAELREMEKDANESLENSLASSFVNRLRAAADREMETAVTLEKMLPSIIGMTRADLPTAQREKVDLLASQHEGTRKQVAYIQDDLAGFYNRTRIEDYKGVLDEMEDTAVVKNLAKVSALISANVGIQSSTSARKWSEQLTAWAEALTREQGGGGGGGGGGGEEELAQADIEVLIALMRSRTREESLRDQTRLLEEGKDTNRNYRSASRKLSKMQGEIADDTRPLERKARHPKLRLLVEKVGGEMMNAGMFLKRPQTDATTVAIETEIIELLSNAISSSSQGTAASQALMAAMGMQSSQGGGSNAGGTAGENTIVTGDGSGQGGGNRGVEKASGIDPATLPAEFRDVLRAYFNAIEDGLEDR